MAVNNCYHRDVQEFEHDSGIFVTPYDDRIPHWLTRAIQDVVIASRALYSGVLASLDEVSIDL